MSEGVLLVICLTVVIVVGVNGALLVALRRGREAGQIDLLRRAAHRARNPWQPEDENLRELSERVEALKEGMSADQTQSTEE